MATVFDLRARFLPKPFTRARLREFIATECANMRSLRVVDSWTHQYSLTAAERETLELAAKGASRDAIGATRHFSSNTLKHHVSSLLAKTLDDSLERAVARLLREAPDGTQGPLA